MFLIIFQYYVFFQKYFDRNVSSRVFGLSFPLQEFVDRDSLRDFAVMVNSNNSNSNSNSNSNDDNKCILLNNQ